MMNTRYKKLSGMHAGHIYTVAELASEIDTPLRWVLHCEGVADDRLIVPEDQLNDPKHWQPLAG